MGRIDAVLDDKLEDRFRHEAAARFGLRKGNLGRAIAEAIEAWTVSDDSRVRAKKTAKIVLDPKNSTSVKQHAVEALAALGIVGLDHLTDIAGNPGVPDVIKEQALKAISAHASR